MNLFLLDNDLKKNAGYLCDSHVVRLTGETTLILTMILKNLNEINKSSIFNLENSRYYNHPPVRWGMESKDNIDLIIEYLEFIFEEFNHRYSHYNNHYYQEFKGLKGVKINLKSIGVTPFKPLVGELKYSDDENIDEIYRRYYVEKFFNFKVLMKWSYRKPPEWLINSVIKDERYNDLFRKKGYHAKRGEYIYAII